MKFDHYLISSFIDFFIDVFDVVDFIIVAGVEEREDGAEIVAFGEQLVEEEIDQVSRVLKLLGWRPPGSPGTGPGGL